MTKPHIEFSIQVLAGGSLKTQNPSSRAVLFFDRNNTKPVGAGTGFEPVSPGHEPGKEPLL